MAILAGRGGCSGTRQEETLATCSSGRSWLLSAQTKAMTTARGTGRATRHASETSAVISRVRAWKPVASIGPGLDGRKFLASRRAGAGSEGGTILYLSRTFPGIDMLSTELAVLSACRNRARWRVHNAEGVFGLRLRLCPGRHQATKEGEEGIVMSLWKEPDEANSRVGFEGEGKKRGWKGVEWGGEVEASLC